MACCEAYRYSSRKRSSFYIHISLKFMFRLLPTLFHQTYSQMTFDYLQIRSVLREGNASTIDFFPKKNCILCQSQRSDQVLDMLFVCATFYICCYIEVNKILKSKIHIVSKLNICQVTRFCPYHSRWI